ncbi:MAG: hypothetical protein V3T21_02050 [Candidatus Margulisiibacteriota bacterium]
MKKSVSGATPQRVYPRFKVDRAKLQARMKAFDMDSATRVISGRFPSFNLQGLAALEQISARIVSKPNPGGWPSVWHTVNFKYAREGKIVETDFMLSESLDSENVTFDGLYPDLPRRQGLGGTIFGLMIIRGNTFAGKEIELTSIRPNSRQMLGRMQREFRISVRGDWSSESDNAYITPPELSLEELAAVEWYWTEALHCPAPIA